MQINNSNISNIQPVKENKTTKTNKPQAEIAVPQKQIELPDIRSNQILLPDNKIYLPTGSKPADFNRENISIELPKNYQKNEKGEKLANTVSALYKNKDIAVYDNKVTGKSVIRISGKEIDKQGVINSAEVMEINIRNTEVGTRYIKDYEHNTETEIKISNPLKKTERKTESKTTVYKDENGKVTKTEKYTLSPYLKGVYDITETDASGKETVVAKTTKGEDGSIKTERNLVSLDGTKTTYRYESDKDGNHKKLFTQITDKDGKVLSTIDRTFDRENDKVTYSSINGNQYKIEKTDDGIIITDYTKNEKTEMKYDDFKASEEAKLTVQALGANRKFSDKDVTKEIFDTLPADTLLTLNSNIKEILPLEDDLDSAFVGLFDYLMCKTDNFVINHELGHSKDSLRVAEDENLLGLKNKNVLADDTNFRETYLEEKAAFKQAFPDVEEKFIDYFLNSPDKKPARGRKETIAESNAINGLQPEEPELLAMRTILLQRYFPRSIAIATKMMNPVAVESKPVS